MKKFKESFADICVLSRRDIKPLGAKLGKLMEETGELAECVNIHQGYITHKEMKEPLVGEVADVVQCALAILVDATPGLTDRERLELFLSHFERKNKKWAAVQDGDADRQLAKFEAEEAKKPKKPKFDTATIEGRTKKIVAEQLGLAPADVEDTSQRFVEELGADSLDLVELAMALEDEFEIEISDADAEAAVTIADAITYLQTRFGHSIEVFTEPEPEGFQEFAPKAGTHSEHLLNDPKYKQTSDPAADYIESTGRHLSLEERMQERRLFDQNTDKGNF